MVPHVEREAAWEAGETAVLSEVVSLETGELYRFRGFCGPNRNGKKTWAYPPTTYRLLCVGQLIHSWQPLVAYCGIGGRDEGKVFFAPLACWHANFTLLHPPVEAEAAAVPELPEKAAGYISTGTGA